jgi:2,3-bisphosphoglycerate-dependent phosphoglycerate mutase
MKRFLAGVFLLLVVQAGFTQTEKITTFILVRHAEKASDGTNDPDLKPEGVKRSESFTTLFGKADITAIYSTNYKRTRNTVIPLANAKGITVETYSTMKVAELRSLLTKHEGGTIIIAGHSNTIPEIANALIGEKKFEQFADDDYGNILVISVTTIGENAKITWLRY